MTNKIPPTITTRITTFCLKVLDILACIFCGFRVQCHDPDEQLQNNAPDPLLQPETTLKERNTKPANTQTNIQAKPVKKPVKKPETASTPPRTRPPLIDNQSQWSKTLWDIYDQRQDGQAKVPLPVDELKTHHRKVRCWSWEWFPAEYNTRSSTLRKKCAFKNENDLLTYYHSKVLMGGFIKLAEEAVKYPMGLAVDELMLSKSLLLCLYAAQSAGHDDTAQHLNHLIKKQDQKIKKQKYDYHQSLDCARAHVGSWLKANCTSVPHWPFA